MMILVTNLMWCFNQMLPNKKVYFSDFWEFSRFTLFENIMNNIKARTVTYPVCFVDYSKTLPVTDRAIAFPDISEILSNDSSIDSMTQEYDALIETLVKNAIDLCNAKNKKLAVWWSGGIDSTAVLVAVLKSTTEKFQRENLVIRGDINSIEEYPNFYQKYILNKLEFLPANLINYFDDQYINIDGAGGDTVFGDHVVYELVERGYLDKNIDWLNLKANRYVDIINSVIKNSAISEWYVSQLDKLFTRFNTETVFDCCWLQGMALNYQNVHIAPYVYDFNIKNLEASFLKERFILQYPLRIFGSVDFFKYSLKYRHVRNNHNPRECSRKYIYDFTKDVDYYKNKRKVSSQVKLYDPVLLSKLYEDFTFENNLIYRV